MRKIKILAFIILFGSSILNAQELNGVWLFNNQEAFITGNNGKTSSDILNFFSDYKILKDTLTIKHIYPELECSTLDENGKSVTIPCPDNSIPDSHYKIIKMTSDSLILQPLNRSAIAISARLKNRFHEQSKRIVSDTNYTPDYFKTIRLYNSTTLNEEISWQTIRISSYGIGWFQEHFDYLEIDRSGTFNAIKRITPFEEGKPRPEYIESKVYFRDTLNETELEELNQDIFSSGILQFEIPNKGWSSHGSLIKIQINYNGASKMHIGYSYRYPKFALPLINRLLELIDEEKTLMIDEEFEVPNEFKNRE